MFWNFILHGYSFSHDNLTIGSHSIQISSKIVSLDSSVIGYKSLQICPPHDGALFPSPFSLSCCSVPLFNSVNNRIAQEFGGDKECAEVGDGLPFCSRQKLL